MNDPGSQTAGEALPPTEASRRVVQRLLDIGENRVELLMVEVQEEREHLVQLCFLAVMAGALGLLAVMALSAALVVYFWNSSPVLVLLGLSLLYGGSAFLLQRRLLDRQENWNPLSASLDQFKKDRACLAKALS